MNKSLHVFLLALTAAFAPARSGADDPPVEREAFAPMVVPPGFSKNRELRPRSDDGNMAVWDKDGNFTPLGRYLYALASDSGNVAAHFHHLFAPESGNWRQVDSPKFKGWEPINQGHRLPRLLDPFTRLVCDSGKLSSETSGGLMDARWREDVEKMFHDMINADGLLAQDGRVGTMALSFHFLRTGWRQMRLRPERIYTLEKSQLLIRTLLTKPEIINPDDVWLAAGEPWLGKCRAASRKNKGDGGILLRGNEVFFSGGLFIGWKSTLPSCHATWDALAIINTLYDQYPEADPGNAGSIFYLWNKEPDRTKDIARSTFRTLCRRLWLNHAENGGETYCWVVDGHPATDFSRPNETRLRSDHAGYGVEGMTRWSKLCWDEIYGKPEKNSTKGAETLLRVLSLK